MTMRKPQVANPEINWNYMEEFGKIFDEEFSRLDRDNNGNRRLKMSFNDNIDIEENLRKKSSEVKGYFQLMTAIAIMRTIERGYSLAPICKTNNQSKTDKQNVSQTFTTRYLRDLASALAEEFDALNNQENFCKVDIKINDQVDIEDAEKSDPYVARGILMTTMIMAMMRVADRGYKLPPIYMNDKEEFSL